MILPERVFGRSGREEDLLGTRELADHVRHMGPQLGAEVVRRVVPGAKDDVAEDRLAGDGVGATDHGRLGHGRV